MKPNTAVGRNEFRMGDSQNGKCEREGGEESERVTFSDAKANKRGMKA